MTATIVDTDPVPAPSGAATSPRAARSSRWPAVVLVGSGAAAVVWIATAVLGVHHGFDITDEGFYLLSYRWWKYEHRTFTGAQYIYGPVFQLLGYDIAALRLFRLVTVVLTW